MPSHFFYHSRELMCIANFDGYFERVNPAFIRELGYSKMDLLKRPFIDFVYPADQKKVENEMALLSRGKKTIYLNVRFVDHEGNARRFSWNCNVADGKIYAIGRDIETQVKIVERRRSKKAKKVLEAADRRFKETFENAGVGLAYASVDEKLLQVNQELVKMLGYSMDELQSLHFHQLVHPAEQQELESEWEKLVIGDAPKISLERKLLKKDGTPIWMVLTVSAVRDSRGRVKYFILACDDITGKKEVEESLKESEESFRCMAEAIPQIVWTANPDGKTDYFNQRWYDYTGLSQSHYDEKEWRATMPQEDLERCDFLWSKAIETGEGFEMEYRIKNGRDGMFRWQLARALPLRDNDGKIFKWFGTCTDIDDQKRIQQELQNSFAELKRSSEERTLLITREKAAVEASRLKSEFLANMSHEIRTPLNGVIGLGRLLLDTHLSSEQDELATMLVDSAESLLGIVNDILDLSKIESGRLDLENAEFELKSWCKDSTEVFSHAMVQKGLDYQVNLPENPIFLKGDYFRIRQIVTNLIQNAYKFTSEGHVKVDIGLKNSSAESRLFIEVEDTGIGMSAETKNKIFGTFVQADSSTTRRFGGSGLGLSICLKLVEKMNGEIRVESELGIGSRFLVEIPIEIVAGRESSIKGNENRIQPAVRSMKILVVEDHAVNQRVISRMLERMRHSVKIVENGVEALRVLDQEGFDLILMDCHMPEMDGWETTREIRKRIGINSAIPVVALTADVQKDTRMKCTEAGMNDYLQKPIEINQLNRVLENVISQLLEVKLDENAIRKLEALNAPGLSDIVEESLGDLIGGTDQRMASLESAAEAGSWDEVRGIAHSIKSSSAMVGAIGLSEAAKQLEEMIFIHRKQDELIDSVVHLRQSWKKYRIVVEKEWIRRRKIAA